tara:strand:+ start:173 stop:400 length:228 start_codon:yes stop_codon:yes gene_type:complete
MKSPTIKRNPLPVLYSASDSNLILWRTKAYCKGQLVLKKRPSLAEQFFARPLLNGLLVYTIVFLALAGLRLLLNS